MRTLLLAVSVLFVGACGPTIIEARDYNQSCASNADCVLVPEGDQCRACGGCETAAINVADQPRYERDAQAMKRACPLRLGPQPVCAAAACLEPEAFCNAGTCATRPRQR